MFQRIGFTCFLVLMVLSSYAQQAGEVMGHWYTEEKKAIVKVYPCEDSFCGKIIWISKKNEDGSPLRDINNPESELRKRTIVGTNILQNLEFTGDGKYEDGEIYDPESGKSYSCLVRLQEDDQLEVRGFVGFSLIGRSTIWTRAEDYTGH